MAKSKVKRPCVPKRGRYTSDINCDMYLLSTEKWDKHAIVQNKQFPLLYLLLTLLKIRIRYQLKRKSWQCNLNLNFFYIYLLVIHLHRVMRPVFFCFGSVL